MKILITGSNGKIGNALKQYFNCDELNRNTNVDSLDDSYDMIIHCASNTKNQKITNDLLYNYIDDNIFLTQRILKIKSKKIVYFSSTAIYPKNINFKIENLQFDVNEMNDIYGITKFISETMIQKLHNNFLILRSVHVLDNISNLPKSINAIKNESKTSLSNSTYYNFISTKNLIEIIETYLHSYEIKNEIINVASDFACSIHEIATFFNKTLSYGKYTIDMRNVSTIKLKNIFPKIKILSSLDCFMQLLKPNE
jgi:nucleoside-diphosphate-sugar epimerase